jgi:exonuclease VII large subunit
MLIDPRKKLQQIAQRTDELVHRMTVGMLHHLRRDRLRVRELAGGLDHLNPLAILSRGWCHRRLPAGTI